MRSRLSACIIFLVVSGGCVIAADNAERDIRAVLEEQQAAWNRGDINAFMNGYWRSETTVFISGDGITRGWQPVLETYQKKYSDRDKMGTLTFSELDVKMLGADAAVVHGRWSVQRKADRPHGRFTLIMRRMPEGWRVVHDHTSAAEK